MGINKNDCLDCDNSINNRKDIGNYICTKGHIIPKSEDGFMNVLDKDCEDFEYQE